MTNLGFRDYLRLITYSKYGQFVIFAFLALLVLNFLTFDRDDKVDFTLNYQSTRFADGYIVNIEETNTTVNDERMFKYYYNFAVNDEVFGSQSYDGPYYDLDEQVVIEYLPANPEYSRLKNSSKTTTGLFFNYVLALGLLIVVVMLAFHIRKMLNYGRILSRGEITKGELISTDETNTRINDRPVFKLTYQYKVNGFTHQVSHKSVDYLDYKNTERIVYDTLKPEKSLLFTNLPISIRRLIH